MSGDTDYPSYCQPLRDLVNPEGGGGICPDQTMAIKIGGHTYNIPPCVKDEDCCNVDQCMCMKRPGATDTDTGVCVARGTEEAEKHKDKPQHWYDYLMPNTWMGIGIDVGILVFVLLVIWFFWYLMKRHAR